MIKKNGIIIVGAGAAGLYCAWLLSGQGLAPVILEAGGSAGRKLAASGGGFANFSNLHMDPSRYLCHPYTDFCRDALSDFILDDFLAMLDKWHLPHTIRPDGRFFLERPAKNLVHAFINAIAGNGAIFRYNDPVRQICAGERGFQVHTAKNHWQCHTIVMAVGSPAAPRLGAAASSWDLATQTGHKVLKAIPSLTPLRYYAPEDDIFKKLAGVSATCKVTLLKNDKPVRELTGRVLFTHKGLSGPAILTISLYWWGKFQPATEFFTRP